MRSSLRGIGWFVVTAAISVIVAASPAAGADIPPLEQRAAWFRQARFGLFIHWGVYSVIGKGEWVRHTGKIPLDEYNKLTAQFHPTQFDAAEWVALAKRAGQKYLVITTKHHDGFCMFDSKLTDYDIMSTPLKRDVIKELADECHRQGMRIGFYYSIMDWHHPDYLPRRPWEKDRSTEGADFNRYVEYMRGQIRELMTNYGRIDILWFDGGWERKSPEDRAKFREIIQMARSLQPHILVNNRANIGGDFETPEQFIPATGIVGQDGRPALWEVCMTMTTGHGSFAPTAWWGYDRYEKEFKPTDELIQKLIDIVSKGGNFLLNVGPEPSGKIRPEETERLLGIGRWMQRYGEAIYGTTASPFRMLPFFGRVTRKGRTLYVHVFDWPPNRRLVLPGLRSQVKKAFVMGRPDETVGVERSADGRDVLLRLPGEAPDPVASVLVVQIDGPVAVEPVRIEPGPDGIVHLPSHYAEIRARHGQRAKPVSEKGRTYIGNWSNPNDVVVWQFTLPSTGEYSVRIDARMASQAARGQRLVISVDGQSLSGKITAEGVAVTGRVKLAAGQRTLSVKLPDAKRTGPPILDLFAVDLIPERK
ncbi:MAG: alpha-L-fucosidase [Planctomycetes bacterium]|nr:alpha-L-fucosidase [Planctomycetota bacterium]